MATHNIERRDVFKLAAFGVGAWLTRSCTPEMFEPVDTTPTRTPYPTATSRPTLIRGEKTSIPVSIPDVSVFSRPTGFTDASVYLDADVQGMTVSPIRDVDWFQRIANDYDRVPGTHIRPDIYAYFDSKRQKLYTGFGHNGRDDEIVNWKICDVSYPTYLTNVSGKFAYIIRGEDTDMISREAAVIVDIPSGKKTFVTYKYNGMNFEFGYSLDARIFAINGQCSEDRPEKGVYLLDVRTWKMQFLHEYAHAMQISEDGSLIYSQITGFDLSSKIINAATGEVDIVQWPNGIARSRLMFWGGNTDVLSPNFKYIATKIFANNPCADDPNPNCANYSEDLQWDLKNPQEKMAIRTPAGFMVTEVVRKITNDGIAYYVNGQKEQLPK